MKILSLSALTLAVLSLPLVAQDKDKKKEEKGDKEAISLETVEAEVTIDGQTINYTVTADTLMLKADDGKERASVFHVSYLKKDTEAKDRPVMFAFNGGPGSSAVWLHLGALGPKLVPTTTDGTETLPPPITLIDNPHSILDVTDLVFIDPVSTGYSRVEGDAKGAEFHGLNGDIESVGDFIRRWATEHKRWSSPKYLLGESYGGIRAAGLAEELQSSYGMSLNGVVMLSSLLDFRTLRGSQGDYLVNQVYLPVMAAVAHYHGKIDRNRDELLTEAQLFANGPYTRALFAGASLTKAEIQTLANKLAELTGVSSELWVETSLRLSPTRFRRELLRDENKVLGRFDARVAWPAQSKDSDYPSYDPSYAVAYGAFSTAMLAYLTDDLGGNEIHHPYRILTGKVHPWKWNSENRVVNVSGRLQSAMTDNPNLRVLIMGGYTDFATPPSGIEYTLNQLIDLPKQSRDRISYVYYEAGHMFYLNEPDIIKMRVDLVDFLKAGE
ncbi:MAG: S10 family peptidase [Roseibacillus sp.]